MKASDSFKVLLENNLINDYQKIIVNLYLANITSNGMALYFLLVDNINNSGSISDLCHITSFSIDTFQEALNKLEEFSLVKEYFDESHNSYIFSLLSPLSANEYLAHPYYSRYLMNNIGHETVMLLKDKFSLNCIIPKGYVNQTKNFDLSLLRNWDQNDQKNWENIKTETIVETYDFDLDKLLKRLSDFVFPIPCRTPKNLNEIAKLGSMFAISVDDMVRLVGKSVDKATEALDLEALRKRCINEKRIEVEEVENKYDLNPVKFLYSIQQVPVSSADKKLIAYLQEDMHLPQQVVNALIEYVLKATNNHFDKAYVEKVASTWSRQGIDTLEKALQQNETSNNKSYSKVKKKFSADEMKAEDIDVKDLRRRLFGEE